MAKPYFDYQIERPGFLKALHRGDKAKYLGLFTITIDNNKEYSFILNVLLCSARKQAFYPVESSEAGLALPVFNWGRWIQAFAPA